MSHRLEVMLTSRRPDGAWTWRAARARRPKGVVAADLLPDGAAVGDVLRVEAEMNVDGITISAILPPKADRSEPERVEHIGRPRFTEGVTGPAGFDADGSRQPRSGSRGRPGGGDRRRPRGADRGQRRGAEGQRRDSDGQRRGDGGQRRDSDGQRRGSDGQRRGDDRGQRRDSDGQRRGDGGQRRPHDRRRPERAPRLRHENKHREAWLATLTPEHKTLADRLAGEGIRAVRQAVQQSGGAESAGDGGDGADERTALVESLFAALRVADWRDRAEAAQPVCDEVDLRDLRSVVAGAAQNAVGPEAEALATELAGRLATRVDREHSAWIADLGSLLNRQRVVTALRVSQRPPKAGTPLPASLAADLQSAAAAELHADADVDLWVRVLEAAAQSPVRLVLTPAGLPAEPPERLIRAVRRLGDRLPALQAAFAAHRRPHESTGATGEAEPDAPDPQAQAEPDAPDAQARTEGAPAETAGAEEPSAGGGNDADADQEVAQAGGEVEVV